METEPTVQELIARVSAWQGAKTIQVEEQPGGKTNRNYRITVDGESFVLRQSGGNTAHLGIDRQRERAALEAAAQIGVAPDLVAYLLPEGHLVTRFIAGREWSPEEFRQPDILRRVADTMRRIHALPPIEGVFDPYLDIQQRLAIAQSRSLNLPESLPRLLEHLRLIQQTRAEALGGHLSLCHNDPWHNNFLDDGSVRLLDWEFAGMGDPCFDLASIAAIYNPEEKRLFLEYYAGEATPQRLESLEQALYVVLFWNATWALIQIGVEFSDFDYATGAQNLFHWLEKQLP